MYSNYFLLRKYEKKICKEKFFVLFFVETFRASFEFTLITICRKYCGSWLGQHRPAASSSPPSPSCWSRWTGTSSSSTPQPRRYQHYRYNENSAQALVEYKCTDSKLWRLIYTLTNRAKKIDIFYNLNINWISTIGICTLVPL